MPPAHVSVTPQAPASFPSQAPKPACETPAISTTIANNENPLGSPEPHKLALPNTDLRHSPRPSPKPSANTAWTFHPKSATVTFHRSPKLFSSHKPGTCIPLLQLPPSKSCTKNRVVPSSGTAIVPSSSQAYPQHDAASSCPDWKPNYGAHSLFYNSPAVCITKRHRDAIKLKLYHLHATLLVLSDCLAGAFSSVQDSHHDYFQF
eukprot:jgi/Psemu1/25500/gm1.25500_g